MGIEVYDISNPSSPSYMNVIEHGFPTMPYGFSLGGDTLYSLSTAGVIAQDINDIANPINLGFLMFSEYNK